MIALIVIVIRRIWNRMLRLICCRIRRLLLVGHIRGKAKARSNQTHKMKVTLEYGEAS